MDVMQWPRSDAERKSDEFWDRNWRGAGLVEVVDAKGRVWHVDPANVREGEKELPR